MRLIICELFNCVRGCVVWGFGCNGRWIFVILFMLSGCSGDLTGSLLIFDSIPLPWPLSDTPIQSVETYNQTNGVDLRSIHHNIQDDIYYNIRFIDRMNKVYARYKINDKRVRSSYIYAHFTRSKKIGKNDFVLKCRSIKPISRQNGDELCWAACLQYIIGDKYGKRVDQNELATAVHYNYKSNNMAASVQEMMSAIGYAGTRISRNGSWHVMQTLGFGHPLIMGLMPNGNSSMGHAVVVVGARYSFSEKINSVFFINTQRGFV